MSANMYGFITLCVLSLGVTLTVYALVNTSLRNLLNEVVKLRDCTEFYSRVFLIGLLCTAFSALLDTSFQLEDKPFMEYVWRVADGLADVFNSTLLFLAAYLAVMTVLVAVLRKRNEQ
jgi:hypothetical protein